MKSEQSDEDTWKNYEILSFLFYFLSSGYGLITLKADVISCQILSFFLTVTMDFASSNFKETVKSSNLESLFQY